MFASLGFRKTLIIFAFLNALGSIGKYVADMITDDHEKLMAIYTLQGMYVCNSLPNLA